MKIRRSLAAHDTSVRSASIRASVRPASIAAASIAVAAGLLLTAAVTLNGQATAATAQKPPAEPMTKSKMFTWEDLKPNPTKIGAVRRVMQAPTTTLAEFESHITTLNPGEKSHDPHTHVNEEILVLKEGVAEAYVNGVWTPMSTGSMVLMGSMAPHAIRNAGKTPCTYYVINWKTKGETAAPTGAAK
jgi:XRE family transcriptional regulator, regulator of sulfur utilization